MAGRTFAFGDIHGEIDALERVYAQLPRLAPDDSVVFLGDYLNRGPHPAEVVSFLRRLATACPAQVVCLRGNHEDAWLRVIDHGWDAFLLPRAHGCRATYVSFTGESYDEELDEAQLERFLSGAFFPPDVVSWLRDLPYWHEDEHAIYVHAGLAREGDRFLHPRETKPKSALLWYRSQAFFRDYRGKRVVFGHTSTLQLPEELSTWTPDDPTDMWAGPCTTGLDTGCGRGGFLTCLELPAMRVYESRVPPS
ncbi:MAG: metallophosphoesterase family protein [Myxococcota bacterium]